MVDEELIKRAEELTLLTKEIESSPAWQIAMKELEHKINTLNDSWQHANAEQVLQLQIAKLATMEILQIVDEWKEELAEIKEQISDQQEGAQTTDFNNE